MKKTVRAIKTKIASLARFCCLETSDKFSGSGKSSSKVRKRQTWRGERILGWYGESVNSYTPR